MIHFTLDDLSEFTRNEVKMVNEILPEPREEMVQPGEEAIRNILSYSRSISVRKSERIGNIHLMLN